VRNGIRPGRAVPDKSISQRPGGRNLKTAEPEEKDDGCLAK